MKIVVKHYLFCEQYEWEDQPRFCLWSVKLTDDETRQFIKEMDVEIDVPDGFDPREKKIAALEKQKQKAMADYQVLMDTIEGKIQSLRAIEYKQEESK